jgi:hypothetical protein
MGKWCYKILKKYLFYFLQTETVMSYFFDTIFLVIVSFSIRLN